MQTRPMTPDEVFLVLLESHREQFDLPSGDSADLRPDTRLREWMSMTVGDLEEPSSAYKIVNSIFGTVYAANVWADFAGSGRRKTVWDACEFIARTARVPEIRPRRILGKDCATAGIFESIRELMQTEGVEKSEIAPSTALAPFATRGLPRIILPLYRLAPWLSREMRAERHGDFGPLILAALVLLAIPLTFVFAILKPWPCALPPIPTIALFVAICRRSKRLQEEGIIRVEFRSLRTFGDLCRAIAGERTAKPSA